LQRGPLFALLFFVIAPGVALLLMWRGIIRAFRDAHRRRRIIALTLAALALWVVASDFMLDIIFETAWGLAHTRPFPAGVFPEGWAPETSPGGRRLILPAARRAGDQLENEETMIRTACCATTVCVVAGILGGCSSSNRMSFFVTSVPTGDGGNLAGLAGADAHCQRLATGAGSPRHWRAYLSTTGDAAGDAVNARDRIGHGPWFNAKGVQIASNLDDLHGSGGGTQQQGWRHRRRTRAVLELRAFV
jgi:hypothetical protein